MSVSAPTSTVDAAAETKTYVIRSTKNDAYISILNGETYTDYAHVQHNQYDNGWNNGGATANVTRTAISESELPSGTTPTTLTYGQRYKLVPTYRNSGNTTTEVSGNTKYIMCPADRYDDGARDGSWLNYAADDASVRSGLSYQGELWAGHYLTLYYVPSSGTETRKAYWKVPDTTNVYPSGDEIDLRNISKAYNQITGDIYVKENGSWEYKRGFSISYPLTKMGYKGSGDKIYTTGHYYFYSDTNL